jgi:hypothetical protein
MVLNCVKIKKLCQKLKAREIFLQKSLVFVPIQANIDINLIQNTIEILFQIKFFKKFRSQTKEIKQIIKNSSGATFFF